jgi:hypothetical protein
MDNFSSPDKVEAFATTSRFQQASHPDVFIKTLGRKGGKTDLQDLFFSGKIEIVKPFKVSKSELIIQGEHKGLYRATLEGTVKIKGAIKDIVIEVYAKTAEIVDEFFMLFNQRLATANSNLLLRKMDMNHPAKLFAHASPNPVDLVNEIRKELKAKYHLNDDDLVIKFGSEFNETEVVLLIRIGDKIG